ncbi:MAG: response regulator transcription factor [Anaerolineales bacterium]|jgi:DNA-binding response OmpR family regulator|nr:Transcriptional regulatory protein WalR [Anaerolineales bacterium]OQY80940.1 MAG: DNA-binding response regulator [Anaerolineae bacterium UTCFX3]GER78021.1 DNA-binding response regulator [Candidatus Denitrolinea symbiosum]MBW7919006.1 response regulator transcription factor [Anaerolineales bacterium]MCZ2290168.1 response regulator transcription factor [Anaerolineales bacterium]
MATRVLIVDDEPRYLRLLEANLRTEGYEVVTAQDGQQALDVFSSQPIDLVLLDIMMPRLDGFGATQRIREFSSVPIIILTAKGEEQDRVRGLDLGADDYLVKPFSATELLARVRAVLRRAQRPGDGSQARFFTHENLRIDFARAEVWRGEQDISLSATEYRLLLQFAHNLGKILAPEDLLTSVWGPEYKSDKEILWVSIARLRQKLEDDPHNPRHIVTRSGLGYLMPPTEG